MNNKYLEKILGDRKLRVALARESHQWFFNFYFPHYIDCPSAPFHKKFFDITENEEINLAVIVSFRGSAKSTIMTTSYPLWSIMGKLQKKLVVIVGRTQRQTKLIIDNIKQELQNNEILYKDMGPFKEQESDLGSYTLYLPWYDAKIIAVSMEQTIRGIRHGKHRPDLIILDDVEDLESVKTMEGRDKIFNWVASEVLPAGQLDTKVICIGNLLHEDSMLMRLKQKIQNKEIQAEFMEIPLIDDKGKITWPGMYPTMETVEKKKKQIFDKYAWYREYLLRIVSNQGRIILPEWIRCYENKKDVLSGDFLEYNIIAVDPAISKDENACKTAMIVASVYNCDEDLKILIQPNPINERLTMHQTIETVKQLSDMWEEAEIIIEDVGMQKAFIQELERFEYPVEGFSVRGQDKRGRLKLASHLVQKGSIFFHKSSKELITQLVNFDTEKYHDLADAFSMLVLDVVRRDNNEDYGSGPGIGGVDFSWGNSSGGGGGWGRSIQW